MSGWTQEKRDAQSKALKKAWRRRKKAARQAREAKESVNRPGVNRPDGHEPDTGADNGDGNIHLRFEERLDQSVKQQVADHMAPEPSVAVAAARLLDVTHGNLAQATQALEFLSRPGWVFLREETLS